MVSTLQAPGGATNVVDDQQLRLAVTMTGGVSLAIWMGGIAREINLLGQASRMRRHPPAVSDDPLPDVNTNVKAIYAQLLNLTNTGVDIDVMSGTSAGGINAGILGFAQANGRDLGPWRDAWIELGSLQGLLRDPKEKDPPSLMYGDHVLYDGLRQTLTKLRASPQVMPPAGGDQEEPRTTVFMTTTFLAGETSRFTDSYGTVVQDTDHQGLFTFRHEDLVDGATNSMQALALAARSSASFPGAFEPSYVPFGGSTAEHGNTPSRPDMGAYANITRPHWAADGGLLANRPLRPLLETIFDRAATVPVRRVLMYVVPTAGPIADPSSAPPVEDPARPLGMLTALAKDLGAVIAQSITGDLRSIRDHNANLDALSDTRLQLAELAVRSQDGLRVPGLMQDYARRQGLALAKPVVRAVMQLISTLPPPKSGDPLAMPSTWGSPISGRSNLENNSLAAAVAEITTGWGEAPQTFSDLSKFGRPAYDGAKATVIVILRAAVQIADQAQRAQLRALRQQIHLAFAGTVPRPDPKRIVLDLYAQQRSADLSEFVATAARTYHDDLKVSDPVQDPPLAGSWKVIAEALAGSQVLRDLLVAGGAEDATTDDRRSPAGQLRTYVTYLFAPAPADPDGSQPDDAVVVARRLFDLHMAQRAVTPLTEEVEQGVELVQVSADTRTLLALNRRTAASKLTGMQLQHFGAFYKASWRANDWMWGRVDGAGWLVHLLLEPRRLLEVATATGLAPDERRGWLIDQLARISGSQLTDADLSNPGEPRLPLDQAVLAELEYLGGQQDIPASLPSTSLWVAQAVQRWVIAEELVYVAQQVEADIQKGSARWQTGEESWVAKTRTAAGLPVATQNTAAVPIVYQPARLDAIATQFFSNPIPDQSFRTEVGQPLLARTITKALATTTGAATAASGDPMALRPMLSSLRGVSLTAYQATQLTKATPRVLLATGLLLIVVGFFVAAEWGNLLGLGGIAAIVAGLGIFALGVWGISTRGLTVFAGFLLLVLLAAPSFFRSWLFSADPGKPGVLTPTLQSFPSWLASTWWHPTIVLGCVFVLVGGLFMILSQARQLNRRAAARKAGQK